MSAKKQKKYNKDSPNYSSSFVTNFETISTKRGARKIIYEGFDNVKKKDLSHDREKFECSKRQSKHCNASIIFTVEGIEISKANHTHEADANYIQAIKIRDNIRTKSIITNDSPHSIMQIISKDLDIQVAGKLPSIENCRRKIREKR